MRRILRGTRQIGVYGQSEDAADAARCEVSSRPGVDTRHAIHPEGTIIVDSRHKVENASIGGAFLVPIVGVAITPPARPDVSWGTR
ncbi:hypothetical protein ThrDRAFT_00806 [Frankia casuarinae]|jgi:hypothetical protein|uniref:Uncharacterized protein n=1 Tax=Frankia casuarinae (strain DSM 45818 / CECT 9043 / HFP020203 / CcI3) TaxID=106370 RepID=Q2J6X5_FRACC|nr:MULTISPECIES: hypothetical protein [Frankia]ABD12967.1 hypothetical protein Francci3_3615 [Frankia casuarinae]ETA03572.1 hypothetical protein CcI6DRAFT_01018 [Frankia sp. CcI6]EYT93477.1 hypothetical protein ThrDRAFT_00806 [Frankia casuarinae]KDA43760.1 hypothetical protein BMG523Draft_01421 [Frankia sp. BMG5.23]OAA26106.1 hypothetical protein AAY23_103340 [Frankia casuarinae]